MMDIASWRWVFWLALPLTGLVIMAVTLAATRGYKRSSPPASTTGSA